jgi:CTP:molybdopterin cytidylyltransferase MocA
MGRPKTTLSVAGRTLLSIHLERLAMAGCEPVVAVVRPEHPIADVDRSLLVRATPADQAGSLAIGLRALSLQAEDVVMVTLVDTLPPRVSTIAALASAFAGRRDVDAVTPRCRGRSGHPIAVRYALLAAHAAGTSSAPLCDVLHAARRVRLDVDDPAILTDLDTRADALAAGVVSVPPAT